MLGPSLCSQTLRPELSGLPLILWALVGAAGVCNNYLTLSSSPHWASDALHISKLGATRGFRSHRFTSVFLCCVPTAPASGRRPECLLSTRAGCQGCLRACAKTMPGTFGYRFLNACLNNSEKIPMDLVEISGTPRWVHKTTD